MKNIYLFLAQRYSQIMTQILFYHLERSKLQQVLPQLLQKTLDRDWRAIVEVKSEKEAKVIDDFLWSYANDSFLPHAIAGANEDSEQPILISDKQDNPNSAKVRFFVNGALPKVSGEYERLVFIFDGHNPEAVDEARTVWKQLKDDNELAYWQQDTSGQWKKKA